MKKYLAILGAAPRYKDKIYVSRPIVPDIDKLKQPLQRVLKSKWLTNDGVYVRKLEKELKDILGVSYCSVFCNGTLALQLAVSAFRLSGEVITTPFTFAATPHVLHWNNIKPVFCDIDKDTYNMDPDRISPLINSRTSAILPVHVFGNPCKIEEISYIAKKQNLKVIYDAAHAFLVKFKGRGIGTYGDASMFSFHATKFYNTLEGGAITCKDTVFDMILRDLRNFGIRSEDEIIGPGINAKMNEVQAIFGVLNLKGIQSTINKRKILYNRYISGLKAIGGLKFQKISKDTNYNYSYFTIEIIPEQFGLTRDQVYVCMRKEGIMVRRYFWPLCSNYPCYKMLDTAKKELLPNANRVSERVLSLPLYTELKQSDVDEIVYIVRLLHKNSAAIRRKLK